MCRTSIYQNNITGWAPEFCERRPEITMEMASDYLNNMYTKRADFLLGGGDQGRLE